MPVVRCPREGCPFATEDVGEVLAAALISAHATEHAQGSNASTQAGGSARPPPMERPKLQAGCPRADYEVFSSKWKSFKLATNISGDKAVHQLLGCLDNDLAGLVYNEQASPQTLSEGDLLELIQKVEGIRWTPELPFGVLQMADIFVLMEYSIWLYIFTIWSTLDVKIIEPYGVLYCSILSTS